MRSFASLPEPGLVLPSLEGSTLVAAPPAPVPGAWAGGPSVIESEGKVYLAYRLRRPVGEGRGFCNVIASSDDGVHFETVAIVRREAFVSDSLERPCLVRAPSGRWRLYVSTATPGTKHWRVALLEADTVEGLADASAETVLAGSDALAVKDPVIVRDGGRWHLWASVHPLERWDDADRMTTDYATSSDGVSWTWHGTVLRGRPGRWDERGVRVSAVQVRGDLLLATYDGRASAAQNWEEFTGTAVARRMPDGRFGAFEPAEGEPLRSRSPLGGLRYLSALPLGDGSLRWYYEVTRDDGAHELRTEVVTAHDEALAIGA